MFLLSLQWHLTLVERSCLEIGLFTRESWYWICTMAPFRVLSSIQHSLHCSFDIMKMWVLQYFNWYIYIYIALLCSIINQPQLFVTTRMPYPVLFLCMVKYIGGIYMVFSYTDHDLIGLPELCEGVYHQIWTWDSVYEAVSILNLILIGCNSFL